MHKQLFQKSTLGNVYFAVYTDSEGTNEFTWGRGLCLILLCTLVPSQRVGCGTGLPFSSRRGEGSSVWNPPPWCRVAWS